MLRRSGHSIACCAVLFALLSIDARAGEEDEIITGCHFSNAEWGTQMIDNCIKDNFANRALVQQYPEQYKSIVSRCRLKNEFGWSEVKKCIDKDIDAEAALKSYGADKANLVAACDADFRHRGFVAVKACVDKRAGVLEEKTK
jgi:hypothetical protein